MLQMSCPPAGPTTADESLFSMVLPGGNFVFTFVLGAPLLSGASRRMATCSAVPVAILRDGRPRGRPPQDEGFNFFTRSFAGDDNDDGQTLDGTLTARASVLRACRQIACNPPCSVIDNRLQCSRLREEMARTGNGLQRRRASL